MTTLESEFYAENLIEQGLEAIGNGEMFRLAKLRDKAYRLGYENVGDFFQSEMDAYNRSVELAEQKDRDYNSMQYGN